MHNELLWVFTQTPGNYIVLDTETTGLSDENGLPDIISLGLTVVGNQTVVESTEFKIQPQKPATKANICRSAVYTRYFQPTSCHI